MQSYEGRTATRVHLNGLLQLVQAAGGLHSPEFSAKTRRYLFLYVDYEVLQTRFNKFRADLSACIVTNSRPILAPELLSDLETYFCPLNSQAASYIRTFGTRLYNFTGSHISEQAANVLWGLRNVSATLERIHGGLESPDAPSDDLQFSDRVEMLERRVHDLWYVDDPENEQHAVFRTFGWASLIYIYCTLRELPPELGLNAMLAGRIKIALEESPDLNVLLATFHDLMLWIMFICGRVADTRDRPFFASNATKLLLVQKVEDPVEIVVHSEGFLWPERLGVPMRTKFILHRLQNEESEDGRGDFEEVAPPSSHTSSARFIDSESP
jgi:hypothetical protein